MVYVLVLIALFAALSFVLSRQSDTAESGTLHGEQVNIAANQIMQTPMQVKQGLDQMTMMGTQPGDFDFIRPNESNFDVGSHAGKVFHPLGGGVTMPRLSGEAIDSDTDGSGSGSLDPGWYLGRFNNVEWTPSAENDIILVAYQIKEEICGRINETLTGNSTIPVLSGGAAEYLIDAATSGSGTNSDLTVSECAACDGELALCVKDGTDDIYSYYNIVSPF